jgi:GDP-mannose 6-dehydrogenase
LNDSLVICVLGLGYVGATSVACLASLGHTVIGIGVADAKVEIVRDGRSPIYEPGVQELLSAG